MRYHPPLYRLASRPSPTWLTAAVAGLTLTACAVVAAPPRVVQQGYTLEQVAREPQVVTPVALAFDHDGRLLVVESHTHQRPDDYRGPTSDRIRVLQDADGDGTLETWSTYADGFRHAMNVAVRDDGAVIVVTRGEVVLLRDTSGDGAADERTTLVRLETLIEYPHNALGGFVLDGQDGFYLGLGENFGGAYRLVGSDGRSFSDSGGTGMVFHFAEDGSRLRKVAQGFWNPFGLTIVGKQTLLAIDNDPDASPPCRLIHVVESGDSGHRFEYGRAGVHPLQAWDGELPGTLPMLCGTGEAPCTVLPHQNHVWVTSWGDHRLERYRLEPQGVSFSGRREVVVQGDADFRPTGCAVAPDGSLYLADWVSRSYPVHGLGRIWRVTPNEADHQSDWAAVDTVEADRRQMQQTDTTRLVESDDLFARQAAVARLDAKSARQMLNSNRAAARLMALQGLRWQEVEPDAPLLKRALADPHRDVRLYATRWIADAHLQSLRDQVAALLDGEVPDERYYLAVLAAIHWLEGDRSPPPKSIADGLLARELRNPHRSDERKALALRLISPDHKQLTLEVLQGYLDSPTPALRREAIRTLSHRPGRERLPLLAEVVGSDHIDDDLRGDAVVGLSVDVEQYQPLLERLADAADSPAGHEAARILRLAQMRGAPAEDKPPATDIDAWLEQTTDRGSAAAGRRLFYSAVGPRCGTCHTVSGRGGDFGLDLTHYGRQHDRRQILTAILQPSRDMAPRYVPWVLETIDGKTHVGLRLPLAGDSGIEPYVDSQGNRFELPSETVEFREPSAKSIMPEGMERLLTIEDMADLVAFLAEGTGQ